MKIFRRFRIREKHVMNSLLDYEIHVLRKHEEEIVLVKSEQKRKITIFQDSINKLRRKVRSTNSHIAKEESALHENIANIRSSSRHVFTNFPTTNLQFFFYQILCSVYFDFLKCSKLRKKLLFLTNKKFVFFFNWEILVKKFLDSHSGNSEKHVVSSI